MASKPVRQEAAETGDDTILTELKGEFRKFCREPLNGEAVVKLMNAYRGKFRALKIAELDRKFGG